MRTMGKHTTGPAVENHISPKMARKSISKFRTTYHSLSLVCQRVLPQLHLHLLLHHLYHRELREDPLHETTETDPPPPKRESKEVQRDISHELPDWLQEFSQNLVDESTTTEPWRNPEQRSKTLPSHLMNFQWSREQKWTSSSSRELPMEPRAKVVAGPGKHSIHTHFPKHRNCDICFRTK